ncbi:MAG TPA: agmatine deiminase family protein, partial [Terriglobales bacterium]
MPTRKPSNTSEAQFRMPAEWEPHAATWLAWPHYKLDWPGKFEPIPWVYAEIIRYLSRGERVEVIVKDAAAEKDARKVLKRAHALNDNVGFHRWPTNRVWTRDSGCAFVLPCGPDILVRHSGAQAAHSGGGWTGSTSQHSQCQPPHPVAKSATRVGQPSPLRHPKPQFARAGAPVPPQTDLAAIKWQFNAWAKYPNWQRDNKIGSLMAQAAGAHEIRATFKGKPVVLEGGSIDVNGCGTLITTGECLLSKVQQRNPGMKRGDYEKVFAEYLGARNVIWLGSGVVGDDTHGHVDDITRFVSRDTVVTCVDADPASENYEALRENIRRLRDATTEDGKSLATIDLPMPAPVYFEGRRLPASYANFYIANA